MAKMKDDELASILSNGIRQASGYTESRLAKERERTIRFYQGDLPNKYVGSNTSYVAMDVWESVENMKAQLMDTFTGTNTPAHFPPMNAQDVEAAHIASVYVSNVIFDQNNGFRVVHDVIDDALIGRNGIAKVWWEDKIENREMEMTSGTLSDLQAYLAEHPDAKITKMDLKEDGVTIEHVLIEYKDDVSRVRIEALPPEEFGISAISKSIQEAKLVFHRQMKSASDLIKEGYDEALVATLQDQDEAWLETEPELLLRFGQTDDIVGMRDDGLNGSGQKARRLILVYECYADLDLEDTGRAELYQVIFAGNTVLHKQRVSHKPFVIFTPMPRPHAFWGTNFAALSISTQTARTYLTRSIVDHALITNNPRYQVVRNSVVNPRELLENRVGGIVNVTRPDGIAPLPQSSLNPFVYQTISMLTSNKEEITGISSLSTGLNKDAISKQNSSDMVEQLISVSQIRQRVVARHFAEGFLRDLYNAVYSLVIENESREKIIQVSGQWATINPKSWPDRPHLEVEFSLGYGEQEKEAQKWTQIDQYLSGQPGLQPFYPPEKRFNVVSKALGHMGIRDVATYILTPQEVKPPQPSPMEQAQLATQQADTAVKQASAQAMVEKAKLEQQKIALEQQKATLTQQIETAKLQLEYAKLQAEIQQHSDTLAHQVSVDAVEMTLQKEAQETGKLTATAEPK